MKTLLLFLTLLSSYAFSQEPIVIMFDSIKVNINTTDSIISITHYQPQGSFTKQDKYHILNITDHITYVETQNLKYQFVRRSYASESQKHRDFKIDYLSRAYINIRIET